MKIEVLLFAQLKEAYGADRLWIEVSDSAKVLDAVDIVLGDAKFLSLKHLPLRYAINEEFQTAGESLKNNDRLALLSPVAGG